MSDDLQSLEDWVAPLLAKLEPAQRRSLARTVGRELRRSQAQRIGAQQNPDGSSYTPRKPQRVRGRIGNVRGKMFAKLRAASHLRAWANEDAVTIAFKSRTERIARVHQRGLSDEVQPGGPRVVYPVRQLLGFTDSERETVRDLLLQHIGQ